MREQERSELTHATVALVEQREIVKFFRLSALLPESTADQTCARQERDLRAFAKKVNYGVPCLGGMLFREDARLSFGIIAEVCRIEPQLLGNKGA